MKIHWVLIFLFVPSTPIYCQSWAVEGRFTPNLISKPKVINPSLSRIYGERRISFDSGISLSRYLNDHIGLNAGWDWGVVDWNFYIEGPRNVFGNAGGKGLLTDNLNMENYFYKAFSMKLLYKIPVGKNIFKISAGPAFRYYRMQEDPTIIGFGLNRTTPYDYNDPAHGPPDVLVNIEPPGKKLYLNIPVSLNYQLFATKKSGFNLGVVYNIAPKPIADSKLTVIMNQNTFIGKFSPRTSFWGLNMQYEYSLTQELLRLASSGVPNGKHRKSLFAELSGNGIGISGNFDMRFKPDRNDGLGFRVGLGSGFIYFSDNAIVNRYLSVPLNLNYIVGKKRSGFESGIGVTPQVALNSVNEGPPILTEGFINLGYRFQPVTKGLIFRGSWTPSVNTAGIYPAIFGISAGYSFK